MQTITITIYQNGNQSIVDLMKTAIEKLANEAYFPSIISITPTYTNLHMKDEYLTIQVKIKN